MRAIRVHEFGAPSVLKLENNVPIPQPADNQVLIRVKAVGVNPVEALVRSGMLSFMAQPPYTPGTDAAGIVEKVGAAVKRFKKGDRVLTCGSASGTYAEYATANENRTFELPKNVTFEQGAGLCVPYFTAARILFHVGHLQKGHKLLVRGASGPVGQACVQLARRFGVSQIVGTAGTEEAIKTLSQASLCGANNVFNHRSEKCHKEIKDRFPQGLDFIVEVLADKNLANDLDLIGKGGKIVIVGTHGPGNGIDLQRFMLSECQVTGVSLYNTTDEEYASAGREIVAGASAGSCLPTISKSLPLDKAHEAHEAVVSESKVPGKIVLIP